MEFLFKRTLFKSSWKDVAVFGGRFSGRKHKDLKINPVYTDHSRSNSSDSGSDDSRSEVKDNRSSVRVVTYESFPRNNVPINSPSPEPNSRTVDDSTEVINTDANGELNVPFDNGQGIDGGSRDVVENNNSESSDNVQDVGTEGISLVNNIHEIKGDTRVQSDSRVPSSDQPEFQNSDDCMKDNTSVANENSNATFSKSEPDIDCGAYDVLKGINTESPCNAHDVETYSTIEAVALVHDINEVDDEKSVHSIATETDNSENVSDQKDFQSSTYRDESYVVDLDLSFSHKHSGQVHSKQDASRETNNLEVSKDNQEGGITNTFDTNESHTISYVSTIHTTDEDMGSLTAGQQSVTSNYSRSALLAQVIERAKMRINEDTMEAVEHQTIETTETSLTNIANLAPKTQSKEFGLLGYTNSGFIVEVETNERNDKSVENTFDRLRHDGRDEHTSSLANSETHHHESGDMTDGIRLQNIVVTEASVHINKSEGNTSSLQVGVIDRDLRIRDNAVDWPDISDLVRPDVGRDEIHDIQQMKPASNTYDDVSVINNSEEIPQNDSSQETPGGSDVETLRLPDDVYGSNYSHPSSIVDGASSTRTLKSILSNGSVSLLESVESEIVRMDLDTEIHESKTVKFSEDTVFNENKPKKYRVETVEKINLRELYRGKISSNNAVAKVNPLYSDEEVEDEEDRVSLTDDEKLAYQSARKDAVAAKQCSVGRLNRQAYMEHYLILKAHGLKPSKPFDINQLPEEIEVPTYDRLIRRTLAKERRKLIVKWSLVLLTVTIITAVATTIGVYYTLGF